jgi:hypothetical protein
LAPRRIASIGENLLAALNFRVNRPAQGMEVILGEFFQSSANGFHQSISRALRRREPANLGDNVLQGPSLKLQAGFAQPSTRTIQK